MIGSPLEPRRTLAVVQPQEGSKLVADAFSRYEYELFSGELHWAGSRWGKGADLWGCGVMNCINTTSWSRTALQNQGRVWLMPLCGVHVPAHTIVTRDLGEAALQGLLFLMHTPLR